MPTIVRAKPGDSVDQMIKKFKKKVMAEEILTTLKEKEFYKKPSVLKKEKSAAFRHRKKR